MREADIKNMPISKSSLDASNMLVRKHDGEKCHSFSFAEDAHLCPEYQKVSHENSPSQPLMPGWTPSKELREGRCHSNFSLVLDTYFLQHLRAAALPPTWKLTFSLQMLFQLLRIAFQPHRQFRRHCICFTKRSIWLAFLGKLNSLLK